jgi:phospholipid transport system substrate-binding protein
MRLILLTMAFWAALFLTIAMMTLSPVSVRAQTATPNAAPVSPGAPSSGQQAQTPDEAFIQDIGNRAVAVMADKSETPDQHAQKYRDILQNSFDMPTIGHFVLGRAWNSATHEQQQEFMKLFEQTVLKTYGDRLNFYSGEGFQVTGERQENDKDTVVNSQVTHADNSSPTKVDWRVRQTNGNPAVVDVVVAGVSQSVTQRDEYASIIQRNNGKIDALLAMMRQRLQQPQQQGSATQTQ